MSTRPRVLLIEDSDDAARVLEARLRANDLVVNLRRVETGPSFRALFAAEHWDAVVARDGIRALDALQALRHVRATDEAVPFVVIVAGADPARAEAARADGATAVLSADDGSLLVPLMHRILTADHGPPAHGAVHAVTPHDGVADALLDQLPIIFWATDAQLRLTRVHGAGLPPDFRRQTILGQHVGTVVNAPPAVHERVLTGEVVDLDFVLMGRIFHGHLEPIRDAGGEVAGVLGLAMDLTTSKDAEHALRESEQRYRALFETMANGVLFVDEQGTIVSVNPAAARILGRPLSRLLGRSVADAEWRAIHEDGSEVRPEQRAPLQAISTGRDVDDVVLGVFNAAEGDYRWVVEGASLRYRPDQATPFQACVTWQDITEARRARHTLRQSEALFRSITENSSDVVAILDAHGIVQYQSASWQRVLGYAPGHLVGRDGLDSLHPDDVERAKTQLARVIARPDLRPTIEVRFRHANGTWRSLEATSSNLLADPNVRGIVINARDITERRAAEMEREAGLRQQAAASQLGTRALAGDALDALLSLAARLVRDTLGVERVEVLRHNRDDDALETVAHGDDHGAVDRVLSLMPARPGSFGELLLSAAEPVILDDLREVARPGTHDAFGGAAAASLLSARIPARDRPFGVLVALAHSRRNATPGDARFLQTMANLLGTAIERERAAERIRFQATVLDAVGQAVAVVDAAGRVTYWNRSAEQLYGYSAAEVLGRPIADQLVPPDQLDDAAVILEKLHAGENWTGEFRIRRKDGSTVPALVSDSPLFDADGNIAGYIGVTTDLTDYRRLEERLRQSQKMEAVGRLAGGVAHDFNNLLTAILGGVEFLLDDFPEPGPVRTDLERIGRAAERAATLTRQLLAFSRMQMLQPRVIDVNRIVREIDGLLSRVLRDDIEVITRPAPEELHVRADPTQLEQVLLNLAANARDAMPDGGRLTIAVHAAAPQVAGATDPLHAGDQVVIEITDTGMGMTAEVQAQIFEPFFTTREPGQGTGLGLSTVYGIINQSGGSIEVESEPNVGSTFRIVLPRVAGVESEQVDAPPADGARILLVEDDAIVRALAARALRNAGFIVFEAGHAGEAMQVAADNDGRIDLLFTDIVMPGRSGRELAEQFRAQWPATPILYTSGFTDDAVVRDAVQGADIDLLEKPYSPTTLVQRVQDALVSRPR